MSGDSSYTRFYDSLGESPSDTSLLEHTLFSRWTIPSCANECLATVNLGGCSATDNACLCKNEAFLSSISACIEQTCTISDATTASSAGNQLCLAVGVTLSAVPTGSTTTMSAISSSTSSNSANGRSTVLIGPIIGGVVGFLVLVAFVVVGLKWFRKSRRRRGIWVRRFPSDISLTSVEHSLVVPSFPLEPFPISSAASQNLGRLPRNNKLTWSGGLPTSPSMNQMEATRGLIPTTAQTPSLMQMSSSSAGTPIGGLYSHAMVGSGSRVVLHKDSGVRLPRQGVVVVEMPPLYTLS